MEGLFTAKDNQQRCWWCRGNEQYIQYHDEEWGRPQADDQRLFEKICLEGFQSGLSWLTILKKRENFRQAFHQFDFHQVARFDETDLERLLNNAGIIRHKGKIQATINNAQKAIELISQKGSLANYFWAFGPKEEERPTVMTYEAAQKLTQTSSSKALSKDLKQRGWKFVGPTTMYAFMQSMGIVNDHLEGCYKRAEVNQERSSFLQA